jgi:hypothetical protein
MHSLSLLQVTPLVPEFAQFPVSQHHSVIAAVVAETKNPYVIHILKLFGEMYILQNRYIIPDILPKPVDNAFVINCMERKIANTTHFISWESVFN